MQYVDLMGEAKKKRRIFSLPALLFLAGVLFTTGHSGKTPSAIAEAIPVLSPDAGAWPLCTTDIQIGCIESFTIEGDDGVLRAANITYPGSDGPMVSVHCRSNSTNQSKCDVNAQTAVIGRVGPCGFEDPALLVINVSWQGHENRKFELVIRTGDFESVFSHGNGISATKNQKSDNGSSKYTLYGFIDKLQSANIPSPLLVSPDENKLREFFETATADSLSYRSTVYVHHASYLKMALPRASISDPWVCESVPIKGIWAEANAQMAGYALYWNGVNNEAAVKVKFEASGPHYAFGTTPSENIFAPARIRVFLPKTFIAFLGYSDGEFDTAAIGVTTANNTQATPQITAVSDGYIIDLGIVHYSSPDPVFSVLNKNKPKLETATTTVWSENNYVSQLPILKKPAQQLARNVVITKSSGRTSISFVTPSSKIQAQQIVSYKILLVSSGITQASRIIAPAAGKKISVAFPAKKSKIYTLKVIAKTRAGNSTSWEGPLFNV